MKDLNETVKNDTATPMKNTGRISDIEILRGASVLLVILHHANGNLFLRSDTFLEKLSFYFQGGIGVDLFFAISGFVIGRDLIERLDKDDGIDPLRKILSFWIRRFWRLIPTAWLWLGIVLALTVFFNNSGVFGSFKTNLEATVAGVIQVANIRFAETFGHSPYGTTFAYWSLSLEEQFYLVLPLLIVLPRKFFIAIALCLIAFQLCGARSLYGVVFRTEGLFLGVILAIWEKHPSHDAFKPHFLISRKWLSFLLVTSLILVMGIISGKGINVISAKFSLYPFLAIVIVWIASHDKNLVLPVPIIDRLFLFIGSRSYSLYVIHIPAFYATQEIWFRLGMDPKIESALFSWFTLTAIAILASTSELNYRCIEKPFRKYGIDASNKRYF